MDSARAIDNVLVIECDIPQVDVALPDMPSRVASSFGYRVEAFCVPSSGC